MVNKKTKNKTKNLILFILIISVFGLVGGDSVMKDGQEKIYDSDLDKTTIKTGNTTDVEIFWEENTKECLTNCYAKGKIILHKKGKLFESFKFINGEGDNKTINFNFKVLLNVTYEVDVVDSSKTTCESIIDGNNTYEECDYKYKKQDFTKEVWTEYNNSILDPGNYSWEVRGTKKIGDNLDWIATMSGFDLDEKAWWNNSWKLSKNISLTEADIISRTYEPIEINVTGLTLLTNNCSKEFRVTDENDLEIPRQILNSDGEGLTEGSQWCEVLFLANISKGSTVNYTVYYNNSLAEAPDYSSSVSLNFSDATDAWEIYNGIIYVNGTGAISDLLYLNSTNASINTYVKSVNWNPNGFVFIGNDPTTACEGNTTTLEEDGLLKKRVSCFSQAIGGRGHYVNHTVYDKSNYVKVEYSTNITLNVSYYDWDFTLSAIDTVAWNNTGEHPFGNTTGNLETSTGVTAWHNTDGDGEQMFLLYNISQDDDMVRMNHNANRGEFSCYNTTGKCATLNATFYLGIQTSPSLNWTLANDTKFAILNSPITTTLFSEIEFAASSLTIILFSPAAELNTTTTIQTFLANITTDGGTLSNVTLRIWNTTTLISENINVTLNNVSSVNVTWEIALSTKDYTWNIEVFDNTSLSNVTDNRTLRIYEEELGLINLAANDTILTETAFSLVDIRQRDNINVSYCNFTITHPDGSNIVNNTAGSIVSSYTSFEGFKFDIWKSDTFLINNTLTYTNNVTCQDRFGTNFTDENTFTPTYEFIYSPDNITFAAVSVKTEHNNFSITAFDDTNNTIIFDVAAEISEPGNFTLTVPATFTLNGTDSEAIPNGFLFDLNGSSEVGDGSYTGNITLTNTTFNITKIVHFTYGISPPSGIPTMLTIGQQECTQLATDDCATVNENLFSGDTVSTSFTVKNTGAFNLNFCNIKYTLDIENASWITSSLADFNLTADESKNVTQIATLTGANPGFGSYRGYAYVECTDGDSSSNTVSTTTTNRPYAKFILNQEVAGAGGSGGGGGGIVIIIEDKTNWTMTTEGFTEKYTFNPNPGDVRDALLLFMNQGNSEVDVELSCSGQLCSYIVFDKTSLILQVAKETTTEVEFTLLLPIDLDNGQYFTNLVATDAEGKKQIVTIETNVGQFGLLSTFTSNVLGDSVIRGITLPNILIALFILFIVAFLVYIIFFRNSEGGAGISILIGLAVATIFLFIDF